MRVAILANDRASFIRPTAEGLARMLKACGAEGEVHYDGIANLMRRQRIDATSARSLAGSTLRLVSNRRIFSVFVEKLRGADLIVVVSNVPGSFSPSMLPNVEVLRALLPKTPIVNYDLHYLPTMGTWPKFLLRDEATKFGKEDLHVFAKGKFGMERYDWYLMASVGTHVPMPPGPHPYSLIGLDLDDGSLYPDQQGRFQVIVDFEQTRHPYPPFRRVQLEALRLSGIDHVLMEGHYSLEEIRAVYRQSAALLLGHAEAFGLPICEVQACGASIFYPDVQWVPAHWLGRDYHNKRVARLTSNFVLYENDAHALADRLQEARDTFDPAAARATFLREQPELFKGDLSELKDFLRRVDNGEINGSLHEQHRPVGRIA